MIDGAGAMWGTLRPMACHTKPGTQVEAAIQNAGEVWTWWEPIRTISEIPFEVQIPLSKPFLFQTLSEAAITLKHQGLSYLAISKILKIDDKTVKKAIERGKKLLWLLMMPFGRSP